ncbi:von Willebrand factor A domain-containing protein 7-like [Oratosquilla oratoria]|uniref:von Willebrand factor A domain-containing protein 7-like n=1 Tax=Oratosquilla oratoria TaxID=337810 RepID=UPI003F7662CD
MRTSTLSDVSFQMLLVLLVLVTGGPLSVSAFLATSLNLTDPGVTDVLCPDQMMGPTSNHKAITREAVRRNIRKFFLRNPPVGVPDFNIPTTASLEEIYRAYYGPRSSPVRFIKAVNSIASANVLFDSMDQFRFDPKLHGDGEQLAALQQTLSQRHAQIATAVSSTQAYSAARSLLGESLHTIQDFYAHSTWVELGNHDIVEGLGLPGYDVGTIAGSEEDVCSSCSQAQGSCEGNVVQGAGMSSGFYTYDDPDAQTFLLSKPSTGGKCSHGGYFDTSALLEAVGGINKDTSSPCFSPHHHLHSKAVELAIEASDTYLSQILDVVQNDNYRRLFDIYHGSALSIIIDSTVSMGDDIDAVKKQAELIVSNSAPELYVLTEYNDPDVGPVVRTDDPEEFLSAVNALRPHGGGDIPEMFWPALEMALDNTPEYGDIFCFTDATSKEGQMMEGMIARAQQQHSKVTIIYSGSYRHRDDQVLTGVQEYRRLSELTGGLFIPSRKFDIDEVANIISEGVQSSDVDITAFESTGGSRMETVVPIDDSILDFEVRIAGAVTVATLQDITGTTYDLTDRSALEADPTVRVISHTRTLKAIKFLSPRYGKWILSTQEEEPYSVAVSAASTLNFLGDLTTLDISPPHPHYRPSSGNPLTNVIYYLEVTLMGYLENRVRDVTTIDFIDSDGSTLSTLKYHGEIDDQFYVQLPPLPEVPFLIKLSGHVDSGNEFTRLMPVFISPVQSSVAVLATSDDLSAKPGENATADFLIANLGQSSDFIITGTDGAGFLVRVFPELIHLPTNGTERVAAEFQVPENAEVGTVSTVSVTAKSKDEPHNLNTAIAQFTVLPKVRDTIPPSCQLESTSTRCEGYNLNGICSDITWNARAFLVDKESGLTSVYSRPFGLKNNVSTFTPGTTNPVTISYEATCCTTQVDLVGIDQMGNVGKCRIDMGLLGGTVYELEAKEVGETWVLVCWKITPTKFELHKYTMIVDNDLIVESRCKEASCCQNVTTLDPCMEHQFQLSPHFYVQGEDKVGKAAYTNAATLDQEPTPPENGVVVESTETSVVIEWQTQNKMCVSQYEVCYHPIGAETMILCERTGGRSYTMLGLEPCSVYVVDIKTVSPLGFNSPPLRFSTNTGEAAPGAPQNVHVVLSTRDEVNITWDDPISHAQCVDRYMLSFAEIESSLRGSHHAAIADLRPCTNYSFIVSAVSPSGYIGPFVESCAATEDAEPMDVASLTLSSEETDSLQAAWEVFPEDNCVDSFRLCYHDSIHPVDKCRDVMGVTADLEDLSPCMDYTVLVAGVSQTGFVGNFTSAQSRTKGVEPNPPQNLTVVDVDKHSIEVSWYEPDVNPQCVTEYDVDIIMVKNNTRHVAFQRGVPYVEVFSGLQPCSQHLMRVRAGYMENLYSPWVQAVATTLEDLPSEPREFRVKKVAEKSLTLTWWQPEYNQECALQYHLQWTDSDGTLSSMSIVSPNPGIPLPLEIETQVLGLTPCVEYEFKVSAMTPSGEFGLPAYLTATTQCE